MPDNQHNWAGNLTYSAARVHRPETVEQLQELVRRCRRLKVLGSRHSFNDIANSPEDLVSLERFDPTIALDPERASVTVAAGVRYGELGRQLQDAGYALHNLASLPHISVAGACATATHGSGDVNGNLATAVSALEMVTAGGERVTLTRAEHGQELLGAVVGLGALGLVTRLTLDIVPTFNLRQDLYENLPLTQVTDHFDDITASAYSVSLFTDWRTQHINQVWLKRRVSEGQIFEPQPEFYGATRATRPLHPIGSLSPVNCTEQMGSPGPWHVRLPHFRLEFTPSSGDELQTEYFVPRQHAVAAIQSMAGLSEQLAPLLLISEVRTVAADELWLSPCYHQASVTLHFTWKKDWPAVKQLLPAVEARLERFDPRPHWGKLFTLPPAQVRAQYERLPDFQRLMRQYDPDGKFRNAFLDRYVAGD